MISKDFFWPGFIFTNIGFVILFLEIVFIERWFRERSLNFQCACLAIALTMWGYCIFTVHPESAPASQTTSQSCKIVATANSDILARLYFRGKKPPNNTTSTYKFSSREFFYEWTLTLQSNSNVSNVVVTVNNAVPDERPRIVPEPSFIRNEIFPHWQSGYREPGRSPDYYTASFLVGPMATEVPVKVIIRRPIRFDPKGRLFIPLDYPSREFNLQSLGFCSVEKHNYDSMRQGDRVTKRWAKLFTYGASANETLPRLRDPDVPSPPLKGDELEGTIEVRCANENCDHFDTNEAVARQGQEDVWKAISAYKNKGK